MTSTEESSKAGRLPGDSEDDVLATMDKRTRKFVVGVTAIFAPAQLALSLTQYSPNTFERSMGMLIVVLLVFTHQRHTAALMDRLDDGERYFRLLVSPAGRILYFVLGAAALGILGLHIIQSGF